jgi:RNA polymerase sigma-70 factor (ECF subfamily)
MTSVKEEKLLVKKTKAGDQRSFEALELSSRRKVTLYVRGLVRNDSRSEEVYQKGLIKAWKKIKKFRGDCRFSTWLCKICRSLAYDDFRKNKRRPLVSYEELVENNSIPQEDSKVKTPSKTLELKELGKNINGALNKLTPNHRQILKMFLNNNMSYKDIALSLNLSSGTVMSRIFHARKQAQKFLNQNKGIK